MRIAALAGLALFVPAAQDVVFQDDFDGKLGEGWTWVRESPADWRVRDRALEMRIHPGNMWGGENSARNVLIRPIPDSERGEIEVSVGVSNEPSNQWEQVDLVWYYDDSHQVKIGFEQVDGVRCLVMGREEKDRTRTICKPAVEGTSLRLRLIVKDGEIRGEYRREGVDEWTVAGKCTLPVPAGGGKAHASLQVYRGAPDAPHWARFTAFRLLRR